MKTLAILSFRWNNLLHICNIYMWITRELVIDNMYKCTNVVWESQHPWRASITIQLCYILYIIPFRSFFFHIYEESHLPVLSKSRSHSFFPRAQGTVERTICIYAQFQLRSMLLLLQPLLGEKRKTLFLCLEKNRIKCFTHTLMLDEKVAQKNCDANELVATKKIAAHVTELRKKEIKIKYLNAVTIYSEYVIWCALKFASILYIHNINNMYIVLWKYALLLLFTCYTCTIVWNGWTMKPYHNHR